MARTRRARRGAVRAAGGDRLARTRPCRVAAAFRRRRRRQPDDRISLLLCDLRHMAGMVAWHFVVLAFFGLGDGARGRSCSLTPRRERIQGFLLGAPPGHKVNIARPIRMRTIAAIAYLTTRVNPIHV